ncbi:AAA family ATPase [Pseudomonas sp. MAFF 311095]|uniref:AAA family ATPase n=1 Tax=Pseudomonas petroselini TaxID=2899822 RepID=A0ABS8QZ46_9PSED|nr:AAA family ATPase [Pseudomonas petroselini]MCD7040878.1 AAA family ATPase [Pseudomonas petroselini]MCD7048234.1 AAA family ATPase [Pseudomonas petroselini]MCD7070721.1 AAA family ATPase [Pseudomonas petroselini]MCD7080698.1 AAA family ATPase [Pseudomonas petroselini]
MQIKRFTLVNFRGIEKMELDFEERKTVALVGVNGVGKSSILDALAITLSNLTARMVGQPSKSRSISKDDIRVGADYTRLHVETKLFESYNVDWAIALNRKGGKHPSDRSSDLSRLNDAADSVEYGIGQYEFIGGEPIELPLAVYYDVHRSVLDVPLRVREHLVNAIAEGYDDALGHGGADFKRFFIWFRNQEDLENESSRDIPGYRDPELSAVRRAIETFTGFKDVRVRRKPALRMTVLKGDLEFNVLQLSDGEKCLLAMVGDLARRLTLLNREVPDPLKGKGVVLIDELDLHLHPGWQRTVVAKLERTFPNCQFIITTHSPQILGELPAESVMLLKDGEYLGHPERSLGLRSGEVIEELMGGLAQNQNVSHQLQRIYRDLDDDDLDSAQANLTQLREKVGKIPDVLEAQANIDSLRSLEEGEA